MTRQLILLVYLSVLSLALSPYSLAQESVSGTLVYTDRARVQFRNIAEIELLYGTDESWHVGEIGAFPVLYENACRQIPFSSLLSVTIHSFSIPNSSGMHNISTTAVTKAGITATYYLVRLSGITIEFLDPVTGDVKPERLAPFINDSPGRRLAEIGFN